ncbi:hypothetical protein [Thermaerobacter composti]|uniref:Uncharacterized protein n=1 Tax=Thermaerobacter composti TaxID=554949 RepID=A0ABZ0QRJ0_9FIRM|nr:hypothetical protein [Thermaerobacter composti]WPD19909.1 hypothetical protein Q5761_04470 [Thermaerobacter composti]
MRTGRRPTHGPLRLGLASNRHVELRAYHVPLGVLIFFVAWLTLAVVHGVRFQPDEPA